MSDIKFPDATVEQKVGALCAQVRAIWRSAETFAEDAPKVSDPVYVEMARAVTSSSRNVETLVLAICSDPDRRALFDLAWQKVAVRQREEAVAPVPDPVLERSDKVRGKKARKAAAGA